MMGALGISLLFDLIWMIAQAGVRFVLILGLLESSSIDPTFYYSDWILKIYCLYGRSRNARKRPSHRPTL